MTETQVIRLASKIAKQFASAESVRRSDVIRQVVRTKKLNLEDSIILADCIVKGLYAAGKAVIVTDNPCLCHADGTLNIDCPVHQNGIRAAFGMVGL